MIPQVADWMPKGFTVLSVNREFIKDDNSKHTSVRCPASPDLERATVEDKELRQNTNQCCRRRIGAQFAKAREHLTVFGLIVVPQLVWVTDRNLAVSLKRGSELSRGMNMRTIHCAMAPTAQMRCALPLPIEWIARTMSGPSGSRITSVMSICISQILGVFRTCLDHRVISFLSFKI